ncbi:MAG TPA: hypothetical protein VNS09_18515 [Solirubrobacter sp.]|nr:hypothetical protein [Solirubrobacter sp.]
MSVAVRLDRRRPARELAATAAAALRLADWRLSAPPWPGFPAPFAGQHGRAAALAALVADFQPDAIVETGTFLGLTTRALAAWGRPVYSIELKPAFFHLARAHTRRAAGVTLLCADSVAGLRWLRDHPRPRRPLAYLDAHWEARLPLHEELMTLQAGWDDVLVVIDDCRVPDDAGYGYDTYAGIAIDASLLELPPTARVAYPALPAPAEGGARRGTLYAAWGPSAIRALETAREQGHVRAAA